MAWASAAVGLPRRMTGTRADTSPHTPTGAHTHDVILPRQGRLPVRTLSLNIWKQLPCFNLLNQSGSVCGRVRIEGKLGKEVRRPPLSADRRGATGIAPREGQDRPGMRGRSSRAERPLLPALKAPPEYALSHLVCSSCLSSEGTEEIQSERNRARRGIKSLQMPRIFPDL